MEHNKKLDLIGRKKNYQFLKIIKITAFLLFAVVFSTYAESSFPQETKVSFNLRNITIQEVLNQIEKDTDYAFIVADDASDELSKRISLNVKDENPAKVLESAFANTSLSYLILYQHLYPKKLRLNRGGIICIYHYLMPKAAK